MIFQKVSGAGRYKNKNNWPTRTDFGAPGKTRTYTEWLLRPLPLPLGYKRQKSMKVPSLYATGHLQPSHLLIPILIKCREFIRTILLIQVHYELTHFCAEAESLLVRD